MKLLKTICYGSVMFFLHGCEKGLFQKKDLGSPVATQDKVSDVIAASQSEGAAPSALETGDTKVHDGLGHEQQVPSETSLDSSSKQGDQRPTGLANDPIATELPKGIKTDKIALPKMPGKKPAFLAKDCGAANEGEMGYYPAAKKAYYCNGAKWVNLPKSVFSDKKEKTEFSKDVVSDGSFLCQKSSEGSFRCMKGITFKQAH